MNLEETIVALLNKHIGRRHHPLWFKDPLSHCHWEKWYTGFDSYYGMCGLSPKSVERYIKENEPEDNTEKRGQLLHKLNSTVLDATIQILWPASKIYTQPDNSNRSYNWRTSPITIKTLIL